MQSVFFFFLQNTDFIHACLRFSHSLFCNHAELSMLPAGINRNPPAGVAEKGGGIWLTRREKLLNQLP